MNAKTPHVSLLLAIASLATGCATLRPEDDARLAAESQRFEPVTMRMTRAELERQLGAPDRLETGKLIWEARAGSSNYERLAARFDEQGRMTELARSSSRATAFFGTSSESVSGATYAPAQPAE